MSEVEFEELLESVRSSMNVAVEDDSGQGDSVGEGDSAQDDFIMWEDAERPLRSPVGIVRVLFPRPANDNGMAWPLIPFPDGWCASC